MKHKSFKQFQAMHNLLNKPIAGYFRLSKKEQATEGALANQSFAIQYAAKEINRILVASGGTERDFPDEFLFSEVRSGRNNKRPVFREVLRLVQEEEICCLIARLDRLTRDAWMSVEIGKLLESSPVKLWDVLKGRFVDFSNPEDWAEFHFSGISNAKESRIISRRVKLRNEFNRSQGLAHAGKMPLGFRRSKEGKYEVIPDTAWEIRRIADIYIESRSPIVTVRQIREEGLSLKFESYNSLTRWLASPVLRGHTPHGVVRNERHRPDSSKKTIFNTHTPALDPQTIARIDRILAENKRVKGRAKNRIYPIAGLMICAHCGGDCHITGMTKGSGAYVYCKAYRKGLPGTVCGEEIKQPKKGRRSIGFTEPEIEAQVIAALRSRAADLVDLSLEDINRSTSPAAVSREDRETMAEIARLEQLCSEMPSVAAHFRGAIVELRSKLRPAPTQENNLEEQRQLLIEVVSDSEALEMLTLFEKKEIFQSFVKAIVLDRRNRAIEVQLWV